MLFALVHLVLRRLFGFAGGSESESQSKDVEILVLRHQLKVLRRLAGPGEIVASASSVEGLLADLATEPREVELKGIQGKVKVQTIRWTKHDR